MAHTRSNLILPLFTLCVAVAAWALAYLADGERSSPYFMWLLVKTLAGSLFS